MTATSNVTSCAGRTVGFIGLGKMGGSMAGHLLRAGAKVTVHDRDAAAVARLMVQGAVMADSPAAVGRVSEAIFLMLPPTAVGSVVEGPNGLLEGLARDGIIIDGGNSDPESSRQLAGRCAARGVFLLDVGMSGGPGGAAAGRLAVMAGGDAAAFERCRPLFAAIGGVIEHIGPSGSGHQAKLVNNMIVAINSAVIGEVLAFAEASGLDMAALTRVISTGAARCWPLEKMAQYYNAELPATWRVAAPERPTAPNQLTWALRIATEHGMALPFTSLAHELYKLAGLPDPPPGQAMVRVVSAAGQQLPDQPSGHTAG